MRTTRGRATVEEDRIKTFKTQLVNAKLVLEKPTNESSRVEANLRAETVAAQEPLYAEKGRVEGLEHELATEFEKMKQLLADRREMNWTASRLLAKREDSL